MGSIIAYENRGISREVFIPKQSRLMIKDKITQPLQHTHLLQSASCIIISLERWRIQTNLVFKSVETMESTHLVKMTASTVILQTCKEIFDGLTLIIEESAFTLTQPPFKHTKEFSEYYNNHQINKC